MDALVKNAADPNQVRAAARREKDDGLRFKEDMLTVLSSKQGRRVLWKVLEHSALLDCAYRPDSETQYMSGRKSVGAWLVAQVIQARPEAVYEMSKEAQELKGL